jgi:uncharacterized membrane protein YcaP (DUF421 family)
MVAKHRDGRPGMNYFFQLDWAATFHPQFTMPEILVRGTAIYFGMIILLRVLPKRQAGTGTIASMLFTVLLGGIAVYGVVGKTNSLTDIGLLMVTVMLWSYVTDYLSYRSPWFRRLVQEPPTCLIRDGEVLHYNLRRERISEEELTSQLRRQDVENLESVRDAHLEADGTITVITKKDQA